MAINKQGLSTGREVREISDAIENELLLNYRSFFVEKNDVFISDMDTMDWKSKKYQQLNDFRESNKTIIKKRSSDLEKAILSDLRDSYQHGTNIVTKQLKGIDVSSGPVAKEFASNGRVNAKVIEIKSKMNSAYNNMIKSMDSQYIKATRAIDMVGAPTLFQALDVVNREISRTGVIATITTNNRQINMSNYIELNAVEFSQELLFLGEGSVADEAQIFTVYVSKHNSSCPLCLPWEEKILIDDVYSNGVPDGKHELLSVAIKAGLAHPNCRHNFIRYIEGVDIIPDSEKTKLSNTTKRERADLYEAEKTLRYNERAIREWKRRETLAMTDDERVKAISRIKRYQKRNINLVKSNPNLYRQYWREKPGFKMPKDERWAGLKYDKKIFDK